MRPCLLKLKLGFWTYVFRVWYKTSFISPLLLKLQKESPKRIFLLGDFSNLILNYELSDSINNFIDTISSKLTHKLLHTKSLKLLH